MKFIKDPSPEEIANYLADAINTKLTSGESVLWLLSGGSAISVAVDVLKFLDRSHMQNLSVSQIDERFGPVGHADSNWQQLLAAGLKAAGLNTIPILEGKDIDQTTADFSAVLGKQFTQADFKVGLFGIGTDGHTAGILPDSPAVESQKLVTDYIAPDYQRITITARAIALLDLAVAYAVGENKQEALLKLSKDLSVREQPAQALKLAKQLVIFNDQIGDNL